MFDAVVDNRVQPIILVKDIDKDVKALTDFLLKIIEKCPHILDLDGKTNSADMQILKRNVDAFLNSYSDFLVNNSYISLKNIKTIKYSELNSDLNEHTSLKTLMDNFITSANIALSQLSSIDKSNYSSLIQSSYSSLVEAFAKDWKSFEIIYDKLK